MSFDSIIGQQRVTTVLKKALATGKLPHAYLFYGPDGVGRFRTARTLASAMFCRAGNGDACGICSDCIRMERESHPGLLVVRPQSRKGQKEWGDDPVLGEIRIDQVREVQRWLAGRSFEGGWRVCVLDGAERMNSHAANALLKTLEEPPPESLLILISPARTHLPATVVSRCQSLHFAPVSCEDLKRFLHSKIDASAETLSLIAALSEGSVGKAIGMDVGWVAGERRQWLERLIRCCGSNEGEATVDFASDLAGCDRLVDVLNVFLLWYWDLAVFRAGGDRERLFNRDLTDRIEEMSSLEDAPSWAEKARVVLWTRMDLEGRVRLNLPLLMEDLLFKLAGPRENLLFRAAG